MRRLVSVLFFTLLPACTTPTAAHPETLREAAELGEARFGVPADLTLALAWTETQWRSPEQVARADGDVHAPALVGAGGLRPWLSSDPVGAAERSLGVSRDELGSDAPMGVLAASAALRHLADVRGRALDAGDPAAWAEVIADYAGIEGERARARYAAEVLSLLTHGMQAVGEDGAITRIEARALAVHETVASTEAAASQYAGAAWVPASSRNYTAGRGGNSVRYIVIHTMQGSYSGSISWFQNPSAQASAHYDIRSSDGAITQQVSESDTAWHAGNGTYNRQSIGIEHEGYIADPGRWYTEAMYRSSAALVRHLCDKYGVPKDRAHIIGHNEVPDPNRPGRFGGAGGHTDPGGGWNWNHFMDLVRGAPPPPAVPELAATFTAKDHPVEMTSGDRAVAWLEFRNDGSATWDVTNTRVGTTRPNDHASPFFDRENWIGPNRPTAADRSGAGRGATMRFSFMITAPDVQAPTDVSDTFGLVQEGRAWFGPTDVTVRVRVNPRVVTPPPPPPPDAGPPAPADAGSPPIPSRPDAGPGASPVVPRDAGPTPMPVAPDGGGLTITRRDGGAPRASGGGTISSGCAAAASAPRAPGLPLALGALGALALVSRRRSRR